MDENLPTLTVVLKQQAALTSLALPPDAIVDTSVQDAVAKVNRLIAGGFALIDGDGHSFKVGIHPTPDIRNRLAYVLSVHTGTLVNLVDEQKAPQ